MAPPLQPRRAAATAQRSLREHESDRSAPRDAVRTRALPGMAPASARRAAGNHRPLAGQRPQSIVVRRNGPARYRVHRRMVSRRRHGNPAADSPRDAAREWDVMAAPGDISNVANVEGWHSPAFARGVRDNVIGEIGLQAVRIGGLVVLARALTPSDFGLFRVLITISAIIMMVNDLAAPDTLVQRHDLTSAHESSAWWATLSVSILTCGALYLIAPLIAQAMAMPTIPNALRLLCIPILLEGSVSVPIARLTRRLEFHILAIAEVVGELAFLGVAIALHETGFPRYSLVGGLSARM